MATVLSRLNHHAKTRPETPAFFRKAASGWVSTSWRVYREEVRLVARAFMALGLEPEERIGVLGTNRPEWVESALGAMSAGAAAAGIYTTNAPEQVGFILRHAQARVAVVENALQLAKIAEVRDSLPHLRHVVVMDSEDAEGDGVIGWQSFLEGGRKVLESALEERLRGLRDDQLATLIYTSGTTGEPKGVMLSHSNLFETVKIYVDCFALEPSDCGLSYLPLAHIAEQMMTIHMPSYVGCAIYYVDSPEKLIENLREVRPTIFFGVPRVWEKIATGIELRLQDTSPARRGLARWAFGTGRRTTARRFAARRSGPILALQQAAANRLVTSKVRTALGFDRLRMGSSGAAPIAREVLEFFAGLGISIHEVYGLSESSGPLTWNRPGHTRLGTVGPALPGVEVRLGEDGEVLGRGPNIFMGYLDNPEATAEALRDGWLHTGDLGAFAADGYLTITGRKKNLIITSGGKNIAPEGIETALKEIDLVGEAVILGDDRRFVAALISLDEEAAARFATTHGIAEDEIHRERRLLETLQEGVDAVNRRFSRVESIREFRVLPRPLSAEEGELTPTLKVKRRAVYENWAELIEEIYAR